MSDVEVLKEGPLHDAMLANAEKEGEEETIEEVHIVGEDGEVVANNSDIMKALLNQGMRGFDTERIHKEAENSHLIDVAKSIVDSTTQTQTELGDSDLSTAKFVQPPYPPQLLSDFLEVDPVHYRSVVTKVNDSIARDYELSATESVKIEGDDSSVGIPAAELALQVNAVEEFIRTANDVIGFKGVLFRAAMDYEAIGWGAFEVVRSRDMKIRYLAHVPAQRLRVLRGWKGFVEDLGNNKLNYYQPFGRKVKAVGRKDVVTNKVPFYDPLKDGELAPRGGASEWNLIDRTNGKPLGSSTIGGDKVANELLWVPKHHSNTIYYGYSDVVPAVTDVIANAKIREFVLQFFEHNTIPRYAIIVQGAKLSDKALKAITEYFSTHVKGKSHKTLIIPLRNSNMKVTFEKLATDEQEGSFQQTKKNNSQSIMTAHGLSAALLGINDAASLGSGKGLSQAEIYKDRVVTPSQSRWEESLNLLFQLGLGVTKVKLKFDPLDIRDREADMRRFTQYLDRGVLTINQVLTATGLGPPVKGGDRNFIRLGKTLVFVDELNDMKSPNPNEGLTDKGNPGDKAQPKGREPFDNIEGGNEV